MHAQQLKDEHCLEIVLKDHLFVVWILVLTVRLYQKVKESFGFGESLK